MIPGDAGFGSYAKLWKPFFIGRDAFIAHEEKRDRILVRFRMNDKGGAPSRNGRSDFGQAGQGRGHGDQLRR